MDLDCVAVDQNVTLYQGQVDVESFRITRQCSCQIASGYVRQTAPRPIPYAVPTTNISRPADLAVRDTRVHLLLFHTQVARAPDPPGR